MRPSAQSASAHGTTLLMTGLAVGAVGAAGALLGAVCPLCVVATPALLSLGVVQKLRGRWLAARDKQPPIVDPPLSAAG